MLSTCGRCVHSWFYVHFFEECKVFLIALGNKREPDAGPGRGLPVKQSPTPFAGRRKCLKVTYKRRQKMAGANRSGQPSKKKSQRTGPLIAFSFSPSCSSPPTTLPHTHIKAHVSERGTLTTQDPHGCARVHASPLHPFRAPVPCRCAASRGPPPPPSASGW